MSMFLEIFGQSWESLKRNPLRSFLTMLGIAWGVTTVTLLIAYGGGFRSVMVEAFDAFGKSAVVCWPGQTSEQAGGERAGRRIRLEKADLEFVRADTTLVKDLSLETVQWRPLTYSERLSNSPVRGVYAIYGEVRNQVAGEGRWISAEDMQERRRVVFLGYDLRKNCSAGARRSAKPCGSAACDSPLSAAPTGRCSSAIISAATITPRSSPTPRPAICGTTATPA